MSIGERILKGLLRIEEFRTRKTAGTGWDDEPEAPTGPPPKELKAEALRVLEEVASLDPARVAAVTVREKGAAQQIHDMLAPYPDVRAPRPDEKWVDSYWPADSRGPAEIEGSLFQGDERSDVVVVMVQTPAGLRVKDLRI